jgi:hypothetical protein
MTQLPIGDEFGHPANGTRGRDTSDSMDSVGSFGRGQEMAEELEERVITIQSEWCSFSLIGCSY